MIGRCWPLADLLRTICGPTQDQKEIHNVTERDFHRGLTPALQALDAESFRRDPCPAWCRLPDGHEYDSISTGEAGTEPLDEGAVTYPQGTLVRCHERRHGLVTVSQAEGLVDGEPVLDAPRVLVGERVLSLAGGLALAWDLQRAALETLR